MHVGIVTRSQVDYALDLAHQLSEEGVAVTLYMDHSRTAQEVGDADHPIERIREVGILPPTCRVRLLRLPRMRDPRSITVFRGLKREMQRDGVELAHILLNDGEIWLAVLAGLLTDVPVATNLIIPVANFGDRLPRSAVWAINKLAVLGSDLVIVNGGEQLRLVKRLYGVPESRLAHIPLSMHTRAAKWRVMEVEEDPDTVLFFGRAHPHKGLEYLVRAQPLISRQVPRARFLISAHGEDLARCRRMIRDQSKFEIIEGFVPGDVMASLFQRATLVALPYLTASTSGVLLTAFSFGKIVVASRVGCLAEYVEDGVRGLLVTPGSTSELADAIVRMLLDAVLRQRMGANARSWVTQRQKGITNQLLGAYGRAVSLHRKA